MRCNVGRIQPCGDSQVLDRFFKIPAFLNEFIPEPVTAEKALRVFGDHLSERIKIQAGLLVSVRRMIPLQGRREPDLKTLTRDERFAWATEEKRLRSVER